MANTKLDKDTKAWLKQAKQDYECRLTFGYGNRFTVARIEEFPGASMACFAVSYASQDEQKVRRKVGEWYALNKLHAGSVIKLPAKFAAQDVADMFVELDNWNE